MANQVHAYIRVSRDGQTTAQQKLAITNAYPPGTEFEWWEETSSAWEDKRLEYYTLVRLMERGSVKELCSCSIDRLGRNTRTAFHFITICRDRNIKLKILSQGFDFSGPFGLTLYMLFSEIAQMESDNKSDRIRRKFAQQKQDGTFCAHGTPPGTVSVKLKAKAEEVYRMLDDKKSYRYIADMLHLSVNSIEKLAHMRGQTLMTRAEFAKKYPGWHRMTPEELYALIGMKPPPKMK